MNIKTGIYLIDFLPGIEHGYANGYIGVPKEHPFFGKHYDDIHREYEDLSVHGGLTYSEDHYPRQKPDGYWWIGFDTSHYQDSMLTCPKEYVEKQIENLKQFALSVI
jgi:hypothetical protein